MKKSNKITFIYIAVCMGLLFSLIGSGVYGLYLSIGRSYLGSVTGNELVSENASYMSYSSGDAISNQNGTFMGGQWGSIILSVVVLIIAIFDIISLFKQIVFFKQFKVIKNSKLVKKMEQKNKPKTAVIVFAVIVDVLSVAVGVFGIFYNYMLDAGFGVSWVLYFTNGLIALLGLVSIVLLVIKIKQNKNSKDISEKHNKIGMGVIMIDDFDIEKLEYDLLKLKHLKNIKVLQSDEYEMLRKRVIDLYGKTENEKNSEINS